MAQHAIVYCGGKNRVVDFDAARIRLGDEPWVLVSANHHAVSDGFCPEWVCFIDDMTQCTCQPLIDCVARYKAVSIRPEVAEVCISEFRVYGILDSGSLSAWWALQIVTGDVYLCGLDLREDQPHVHTNLFDRWSRFVGLMRAFDRRRLLPMSGPLKKIIDKG